jgi:hypothetical protein
VRRPSTPPCGSLPCWQHHARGSTTVQYMAGGDANPLHLSLPYCAQAQRSGAQCSEHESREGGSRQHTYSGFQQPRALCHFRILQVSDFARPYGPQSSVRAAVQIPWWSWIFQVHTFTAFSGGAVGYPPYLHHRPTRPCLPPTQVTPAPYPHHTHTPYLLIVPAPDVLPFSS